MLFNTVKPPSKLINIQKGYRPMDFMNSVTKGGAFNSVFNVNTNKHKMLYTTVILICNKMKNYLQNLIHKNIHVF